MMTRPTARRRLLSLALAAALAGPVHAQNYAPFTATDIRVDGLQRISAGTVFSYLPIERGDMVDRASSADAVRALFKTGFFSDIRLERQGDILVVTVIERPAINAVTLVGNKDIKSEELLKGLKQIGLSEGETYNPLNLDRVTQELLRQYNNKGKYGVIIEPTVANLDRNRVDVTITITEGKGTKIQDINIVGNEIFTDKLLRESWESNTSSWLSWYKRDDQYSREKLSGDLEKLSNYYLDRGYADFNVESTQVAISPDKKDMFITANVTEGTVYKISSVKVSGETIIPLAEAEKLLFVRPGMIFSRQLLTASNDSITSVLGNIGYAFAAVNPIPEFDREKHEISLNFVVDPGPRVQVRRISFKGNVRTSDEVIRRELRQFEGTWYSQAALDRSKIRLQRLGYFDEVTIETPAVPGKPDQVDVVVSLKERNSGTFVFGLGYQQVYGVTTSIQLSENNFLGSGNRLSVAIQNNSYSKRINFSYIDPYFTDDGVSVGYNFGFSDFNSSQFNTARFDTTNANGEVTVGIPLSETDSVQFALGIDRVELTTDDASTPPGLIEYLVSTLGDRGRFPEVYTHVDDDGDGDPLDIANDDADPSTPDTPVLVPNAGNLRKWVVNAWRLQAGWARDSRNDYLLPTRGTYNRISAEVVLPGSDLEYYKLSYQFEHYRPLSRWLVAKVGLDVGYGNSYGKTKDTFCFNYDNLGVPVPGSGVQCGLPFFKNFYAGGTGSLRGFETNSLGPNYVNPLITNPTANDQQPLGGSVKTIGTFELLFPTLFKARGTRLAAFVDFGNVFASTNDFSVDEFRVSAGMALQWQAPIGPITISYAFPFRYNKGTLIDPDGAGGNAPFIVGADRIERLQFSFGSQF